jgi:hypothetical protein
MNRFWVRSFGADSILSLLAQILLELFDQSSESTPVELEAEGIVPVRVL